MSKKYVAADCGKANTKVFMYDTKTSDTDKAVIATNVAPVNSLVKASMGHSQYIVNINTDDDDIKGEWMIGAVGGESSYSNSKKDKIHKIMALVGIALVTRNGDTVVPAIGCPISIFEDEQQKAELYDYLIPDGRVDISVNGTDHYFYIEKENGMIFPESFGALFLFPERFKDQTGVIDIGGLNMNASFFNETKLDPDLCTTEKLGCSSIVSSLRKKLNAVCDASYDDRRIESFLKSCNVPYFEEGSKVIEEALTSHVGKIDMVLKDWDTSKIDMIFIGGTSKLLEKYILERYGDRAFIPEDTDFINCKGFLKAMVSMSGYTCPI